MITGIKTGTIFNTTLVCAIGLEVSTLTSSSNVVAYSLSVLKIQHSIGGNKSSATNLRSIAYEDI